jgi:hypothetical protein
VSNSEGIGSLNPDTETDGVFWLGVNVGSDGPKRVSDIRLSSTQPFEWDTIDDGGSGAPVLGVYSGQDFLNNADGTISGVLFNSGLVLVQLWASDLPSEQRFEQDQYVYTVEVNFNDGSSLSAQTGVWGTRSCP